MLRWQEEGQQALITDPKQPVWVDTPMSTADKSLVKRNAKLTSVTMERLKATSTSSTPAISRSNEKKIWTKSQKPNVKKA